MMEAHAAIVQVVVTNCGECPHKRLALGDVVAYYCEAHMIRILDQTKIHERCKFKRMKFGEAHNEVLRSIGRY